MKQKILVTGGSGFIGSFLVKELERLGNDVYILTNQIGKVNKKIIFRDITDRKAMLSLIPKFETVYHLAGLLGTSELVTQAYEASTVNILGTVNILDGALINKTKVVEITKPNCWLNTYSITKFAGESFTKMYHELFSLPTVSIKWFNVYGPRQSFHCQKAVPFFIRWALKNEDIVIWGEGDQTADFIHAEDAVRATISIASHPELEGQTIDVGSGVETSVNKLAKIIIKETNSKSHIVHMPMRIGETPHTKLKADISILNKIGFKFIKELNKGLKETIDWYKNNLK